MLKMLYDVICYMLYVICYVFMIYFYEIYSICYRDREEIYDDI